MRKIRLGRTGLMVTSTAFGALPVQRVPFPDAVKLLRRAYNEGINFFDTANVYSDSEEKLGTALSDVRHNVIIATKSGAHTKKAVLAHLEESLRRLKTDYIDVYQLHNRPEMPDPEDPDGIFSALLEARQKGWVRYIGLTAHRLPVAMEAVKTGLFDTLQFPFSYLYSDADLELVQLCKDTDTGFIAMKGLCGGLLNYAPACFAFMRQFDHVVPIWGIQRETELDEFLALEKNPPVIGGDIQAVIDKDRKELAGNFCRGCGYCLPCPAGIEIFTAARMKMLLRRAPYEGFVTPRWRAEMDKIRDCIHCGACASRCPYGLNPAEILVEMLTDYDAFYKEHALA